MKKSTAKRSLKYMSLKKRNPMLNEVAKFPL